MSSMVPCAPSNMTDSPGEGMVQHDARCRSTNGAILAEASAYSCVHFVGIKWIGIEKRVRDHVFFAAGIFDVRSEQLEIQQVCHPQSTAAHLVFISGTDATGCGADFYAAGRVLGSQFNHPVVGENYMGAVADEDAAIHFYARFTQAADFFQKCHGVENDAIANHAAASGAQHAAGTSCKINFLPLMMTVWPALCPPA